MAGERNFVNMIELSDGCKMTTLDMDQVDGGAGTWTIEYKGDVLLTCPHGRSGKFPPMLFTPAGTTLPERKGP